LYDESKVAMQRKKKVIARRAEIDFNIMESIWSGDSQKFNEFLSILCIKHKRWRNDHPLRRELLSLPGAVYAKIATMKGLTVSQEIPYIPHHLLEWSNGDEKYEAYDFMKRPPFTDHVNIDLLK
jgi:tRNA A37 N6-isopentenylltransferase MiaA